MELNIRASRVYRDNLQSNSRITINIGGSRSTKTYSLAQLFMTLALEESGEVLTICRKTLPALKATALRDFIKILRDAGIWDESCLNKSDLIYHLHGNEIEFISVDQADKIKGRKRKHLWINEANELSYDEFQQLIMRTTGKVFLDYNPSDYNSWLRESVETRDDARIIHSTFRDNPFLEPEIIKEIARLEDADPNYWKIYGLGQYGIPQTLVYSHWQYCDELPGDGERIYGLDFGWNHPLSFAEIRLKDNDIYADELIYESNLKIDSPDREEITLVSKLRALGISGNDYIYADTEDPQSIRILQDAGFNVINANKAPGSVLAGIREIQKRKFFITKRSTNFVREVKSYSWKVKDNKPTDEPVKLNDDGMDSIRYPVYSHLLQPVPRVTFL